MSTLNTVPKPRAEHTTPRPVSGEAGAGIMSLYLPLDLEFAIALLANARGISKSATIRGVLLRDAGLKSLMLSGRQSCPCCEQRLPQK